MILHNILLIYRNFKKFKTTFFINLMGLSTGLACALLIYLWVYDELNFDKFHQKGDQLFRVMLNKVHSQKLETSASTQAILAAALLDDIPEVEYAVTTIASPIDFTLSFADRHIVAKGQMAESDLFNIFSFDLLQGNKSDVLSNKQSVVMSEATAEALFGSTHDVIGKVIAWQFPYGKREAVVTGIYKNIPASSSLQFDFVLPFAVYKDIVGKESLHWGNYGSNTFVLLSEGTDVEDLNKKIAGFISSRAGGVDVTPFLIPFANHYLYSAYKNGVQSGGRIEYVALFSTIALFILLIACINFMNLSTAKASSRLKEIGIKKAVGAYRSTLIAQYIGESMSLALLSLIVAFLIVDIFLPQFNVITGKSLSLRFDVTLYCSFLAITVFTGLVAGSYPAFYLSGFNPALVLKGKMNTRTGLLARRGLVIFQFCISVIFIVSVIVVYKQTGYVQSKSLGYDKNNVLYFRPQGRVSENTETFLSDIKKIPGVVNAAALANHVVEGQDTSTGYFHWEGKDPDEVILFGILGVSYDMIETLGIEVKTGRTFSRDFTADTSCVIFNEAAI